MIVDIITLEGTIEGISIGIRINNYNKYFK